MKQFFAEICKVDDEKRMVYGYASTEAMDVQGEIVTKDAMAAALEDYMRFANIREMHQPSAVGVAKSAEIDDKGTFISAHVVDDSAWSKVKAGVYKGFSIGGKALEKVDNVINALRLTEISLVDRPANPEALITLWKADAVEHCAEEAVTQLAAMLNKGTISAQRLVELANAHTTEATSAGKGITEPALSKAEGEEVWDAGQALQALASIQYVLQKEREELAKGKDEGGEAAKQVSALETAVVALKEFIASEIQEDNAERLHDVQMAAAGGHIHKVGRRFSGASMAKMQDMHDSLVVLGVNCSTAKTEQVQELAKLQSQTEQVLEKVAQVQGHVQRLFEENTVLKAEVTRLKAQPAPGKALLNAMAISKSLDLREEGGASEAAVATVAPVLNAQGQVNDAASLIKMLHSKGGVAAR
ncbi:XkdF-like putative serine protease domain-containing protein [Limnohabitans sp.]